MATFTRAASSPTDGLKNTTSFPTSPADETAARKQIQDVIDKVNSDINVLQAQLEAIAAAAKIGCAGTYSNIQDFINAVELAGSGNVPPDNSLTVAKFTTSAFDTDGTLTANSDTRIASQKAGKTYADTKIPKTDIDTDTALTANSDTKVASQKAGKAYTDAVGSACVPKSLADAAGDTFYATDNDTWAKLAKGTAYYHKGMNAGASAPEWQPSATSVMTAAGDMLYASGANTLARLAKQTDAQVMTLVSGLPAWATNNNYVSASATILLSADTERSQNAVAEVTKKTFTVNLQGFYRVYFKSKLANWSGYGGNVIVYLNGVKVVSEPLNASDSTYAEHYVDLPWAYAGSTIDIKLENGNVAETAYVKDCRVAGTVTRIADAATLD